MGMMDEMQIVVQKQQGKEPVRFDNCSSPANRYRCLMFGKRTHQYPGDTRIYDQQDIEPEGNVADLGDPKIYRYASHQMQNPGFADPPLRLAAGDEIPFGKNPTGPSGGPRIIRPMKVLFAASNIPMVRVIVCLSQRGQK